MDMKISTVQKISWLIMRFLNCFFFKFRVVGQKNIDQLKGGPLIIACNHKSFWDHFFLGYAFKYSFLPLRFIAADRFFKGWKKKIMLTTGAFPARKGQGLEVSLETPTEILKNNGIVVFYPEGKIIPEKDALGKPKRGIGALSLWSNAPILPVALKGTRGMRHRKNVKVIFGQPFFAKDLITPAAPNPTIEDFDKVSEIVMEKVKKLYFS
jgi:1-acyl-sn-glycerol-3-phosphate acyltransferase